MFQGRVWRIRIAEPPGKTVPAALRPAGTRMNFKALFPLLDHTTRRMPAFLLPYLTKTAKSFFRKALFHNFFCLIQVGQRLSIYSTNPCSVKSPRFHSVYIVPKIIGKPGNFYPF
jgi:hypothetical protein